ncbi:MAG: flippase [Anaerolineae bacterium]|nr:flippase [Anaerolineae bacterium]
MTISANDAQRAARNVGALVVASILSKGILFGWQIVLGTWLTTIDYGIYNTVFALFALGAPIASLSMGMIAIREIARKPEAIGQYAASMVFSQTVLSIVAYVIVVGASYIAYDSVNPAIVAFTAIAGISLIVDIFGNIAHDLLIAQERMIITSTMEILQIILRVGLAAYALWAGWGLFGIYMATIAAGLIRSISLWTIHVLRGLRLKFPLQWDVITLPLLMNASPLAFAAMLSLGYDHADKLMMTGFLGEIDTAILSPAFLIHFGVIELLSTTVLVAIFPLMSRMYGDGKGESFGFVVEKLARFMLMVALPIVLVLAVFADDVILFIYPDRFLPTIGILRIYVWYTLFTMVGNVFSKALIIQNRQTYTLWVRGASLTLNIILNAYLLWRFRDPRGAAVASVGAEILAFALMTTAFRARGFNWARIIPSFMRVLLLGAVMTGVMIAGEQIHVIVGMIAGATVYLAGLLFAGVLSADDWDLLYRLTAAMPGGAFIRRYRKRDIDISW